jgi:hypothetical protein
MPVDPADLGAAVCRAVMALLYDKPVVLEIYNHADPLHPFTEVVAAGPNVICKQWCAVLLPLPDMVSVRAHLKYWGMGIWDRAELSPDAEVSFRDLIFVRYPDDPAQITGPAFEAELREATEKALAAVEAGRPVRVPGNEGETDGH